MIYYPLSSCSHRLSHIPDYSQVKTFRISVPWASDLHNSTSSHIDLCRQYDALRKDDGFCIAFNTICGIIGVKRELSIEDHVNT